MKLSRDQRRVLLERCELPPDLAERIRSPDEDGAILLSVEQLDVLRGCVADRLQRVGFDDGWALTPEGESLEAIIDRLQPPPDNAE